MRHYTLAERRHPIWEALAAGDDMGAIRRDLPEEFWTDFDDLVRLLTANIAAIEAKIAVEIVEIFGDGGAFGNESAVVQFQHRNGAERVFSPETPVVYAPPPAGRSSRIRSVSPSPFPPGRRCCCGTPRMRTARRCGTGRWPSSPRSKAPSLSRAGGATLRCSTRPWTPIGSPGCCREVKCYGSDGGSFSVTVI